MLAMLTPASFSRSIIFLFCSSPKNDATLSAMICPNSSMVSSSSVFASIILSMEPKLSASSFAALCPICLMPRPNISLSRSLYLEFSMDLSRFSTDFHPFFQGLPVRPAFIEINKSAIPLMNPLSSSISITAGPSPSIFIASLDAK